MTILRVTVGYQNRTEEFHISTGDGAVAEAGAQEFVKTIFDKDANLKFYLQDPVTKEFLYIDFEGAKTVRVSEYAG